MNQRDLVNHADIPANDFGDLLLRAKIQEIPQLVALNPQRYYNLIMDQHSNKTVIDETDQKIIEALQIDGRRPFTKLAAELGISEASVRQRVANLINTHVIQVVAVTNPAKLGYTLAGMIGIRVLGDRLLEVAEQISSFDEVTQIIICTGSFDLLAEVVCQNNDHLLRFLTEKLYKVEGVQQTETFLYLRAYKTEKLGFFSQTRLFPPPKHVQGDSPPQK